MSPCGAVGETSTGRRFWRLELRYRVLWLPSFGWGSDDLAQNLCGGAVEAQYRSVVGGVVAVGGVGVGVVGGFRGGGGGWGGVGGGGGGGGGGGVGSGNSEPSASRERPSRSSAALSSNGSLSDWDWRWRMRSMRACFGFSSSTRFLLRSVGARPCAGRVPASGYNRVR